MPSVTLELVARRAGVSLATASRALRGVKGISSTTVERVRGAAAELGYRPNALVSVLMEQVRAGRVGDSGMVIALLEQTPDPASWIQRRYYRRVAEGMRSRARDLGARVDAFSLDAPATAARLGDILKARGIRAVLLPPSTSRRLRFDLDWSGFAVAAVGRHLREPRVHRVVPDAFANLTAALARLREAGVRRIGYAIPVSTDELAGGLFSGAYESARSRLAGWEPLPRCEAGHDQPESLARWARRHGPEAVLCVHGRIGRIVAEAAAERRRGANVKVIDLNADPEQAGSCGIDQRLEHVGAAAVERVIAQLHLNQAGVPAEAETLLVAGRWIGEAS